MATSLSKLQATITRLEKKVVELEDKYQRQKELTRTAEMNLKYYKDNLETIVQKAVDKAVAEVTEHYEEKIKEKDQRIFELETRLNINSETSSLPSSKDPLNKPKKIIQNNNEKTENKIGGQLNHKKASLLKFKEDEVTEFVNHESVECNNCHSKNLKRIDVKERDELDFEIIIKKKRHKFYKTECNDCGHIMEENIPSNLHAENQYGTNVKNMIITLYDYGFVSYSRTREIICGLTNGEINPSEGYMVKVQTKAGNSLENFVFDVGEVLKKSKLVHWDDTVVRIGEKEKACFRSYTNREFVLFKAHNAKNAAGMDEDGILNALSEDTVVVHDHLKHNYCDDYKYQNAECNAHATRKLKGITVNTNHKWSDDMEKLLKTTLNKRKQYLNKGIHSFSKEELDEVLNRYDDIVSKGFVEYIEFKHQFEYENEENLLEFFRDYKENITYWIRDFSIPYSNNFVESLLRMIKSKMKISMQFKTLEQARYFANIRSYIETCGHLGIHKGIALSRLFNGEPYTVQELLEIKEERDNKKTAENEQQQ